MKCRYVRDLADSLVAGHLPARMARELLQHLGTCPGCQAEFDAQQSLRASVRWAFEHADALRVSPEFVSALAAELRARTCASPRTTTGWLPVVHTRQES